MTTVRIPDERATPEFIKAAVDRLNASENPHEGRASSSPVIFEKEFTVMLGGPKAPEHIKAKLREDDYYVGDVAEQLLGTEDYMTAIEKVFVRVGVVSGHELGFTKPYSYQEFMLRAAALGLRPVISEAAVGLRSVYTQQPVGERIVVASRPLGWRGECYLFCVDNTGEGRYISALKMTTKGLEFSPSCLWLVSRASVQK